MSKYTTINLTFDTWKDLMMLKKSGSDTFEKVIKRLIEDHKKRGDKNEILTS